jgi:TATA-binding protein-associated factor
MNPKRRSEIAHDFNTQSNTDSKNDIRLLLMTTKACGLGLNLTAADTVIFLEHDWNPYVDMQAMDRAHRIGQRMPVTVYRLIAESTIEARILGLQHHKLTLANEIINDDNTKSITDTDKTTSNVVLNSIVLSNPSSAPISNNNTYEDYETMDLDNFLTSIGCD